MDDAQVAMDDFVTKMHQATPEAIADAWINANCKVANDRVSGRPSFSVTNAAAFIRQANADDKVGTPPTFPTADTENKRNFIHKWLNGVGHPDVVWSPHSQDVVFPPAP